MGTGNEAKPLSRKDIRRMAKKFRKRLGIENVIYVDVLRILEIDMPNLFPNLKK